MPELKSAELFSGYGGLALAVERVFGAKTAWFSEYEAGPSKILAHHWPTVPNYGDVTEIDWSAVEPVDIISGGYPCQPFSLIGSRKGHSHEQHLWPYTLEAIRSLRPRYAVFENVPGHRSMGFDAVLCDLAESGYDVSWTSVRASTIGAPHQRERLFILATDPSSSRLREHARESPAEETGTRASDELEDHPRVRATTDWGPYRPAIEHWGRIIGRPAPNPTVISAAGREQENYEFHEWMMGLPVGWVTGVGIGRGDQAKALGNGVIPQQAEAALRHLMKGWHG